MKKGVLKAMIVLLCIVLSLLSLSMKEYKHVEAILCILFILGILSVDKREGFSIYVVFLFTLFFFCVVEVFGDFFGVIDISRFEKYGVVNVFSNEVLTQSLRTIIFFLDGIIIAHYFGWRKPFSEAKRCYKGGRMFPKQVKVIMVIAFYTLFLFAVAKAGYQVALSYIYGYVESVHIGGLQEMNYWVNFLANAFEILGLLCLFTAEDGREFRRLAVLYAIPFFISIFTGQRGPGIIMIITLLWVYNTFYKNVSKKTIVIWALFCLGLIMLVGVNRELANLSGSIFDKIIGFVLNQGESFHVITMTVKLQERFNNNIPFFVGYFSDLFSSGENYTIEAIINKNYLGYHLAYLAYPSAYFNGLTIGTSLIAELFELVNGQFLLVMPLSAILMGICYIFANNLYKNPIVFSIGFRFVMYFIYSPRDSVGKVITLGMIYTIVFMIMMIALSRLLQSLGKKAPSGLLLK